MFESLSESEGSSEKEEWLLLTETGLEPSSGLFSDSSRQLESFLDSSLDYQVTRYKDITKYGGPPPLSS